MKSELDYFPHYTNIFWDRNIRELLDKHKSNGYLIYTYVKNEIFRVEGYYLKYNDKFPKYIHGWFPFIEEAEIAEIIKFCAENELFHRGIFEEYQILTSSAIQENFKEIMKRCKRKMDPLLPSLNLLSNLANKNNNEEDYSNNETELSKKTEKRQKNSGDISDIDEIFKNNSEEIQYNEGKTFNISDSQNQDANSAQNFSGNILHEEDNKITQAPQNKLSSINPTTSNRISLSNDRDRIYEILVIEKNYYEGEIEKFMNHYSKVGWLDKNGNSIKDVYAAAKNWIQQPPAKNQIPLDLHARWKNVWLAYKKQIGFEQARHLLNINPTLISEVIYFSCSIEERDICEKNIDSLKEALRSVFGVNIKLQYTITK
ncbi:MAG: DUF4373 domain-containing protein [Salinivirgaceae bacterium]|jgi:hypothetical protein